MGKNIFKSEIYNNVQWAKAFFNLRSIKCSAYKNKSIPGQIVIKNQKETAVHTDLNNACYRSNTDHGNVTGSKLRYNNNNNNNSYPNIISPQINV